MSDKITIGGVTFYSSEVKSNEKQSSTIVTNRGEEVPQTNYIVVLNNGTKLEYPEQQVARDVKVFGDKYFSLEKAKVTDTPKDDKYQFFGCDVTLNANKKTGGYDNDKDYIEVQDREMPGSTPQKPIIQKVKSFIANLSEHSRYYGIREKTHNSDNETIRDGQKRR